MRIGTVAFRWRSPLRRTPSPLPQHALRSIVPGVVRVPVVGSSVFLLLDQRVTIVDAGPIGSAERILEALRRLGRTSDDVVQVLITHCHPDHAGGLAALQRRLPARTAAHMLEAPPLRGEAPLPLLSSSARISRALRPLLRTLTPPARIDDVLRDGDELPVFGGLRVVHTPGHTPGHIALFLPERRLLIAGDALKVHAGNQLAGPARRFCTDPAQALRSLRRLTGLDVEVLALSHFPVQTVDVGLRLAELAGLS